MTDRGKRREWNGQAAADPLNAEIGKLIKRQREKAGKSQGELADALGRKAANSVARMELGKAKILVSDLVAAANFFEIPLRRLIPRGCVQ